MERPSEQILLAASGGAAAVAAGKMALDDYLDSPAVPASCRRAVSSLLFTFFRRRREIRTALFSCCRRPPVPAMAHLLEVALTLAARQRALAPESAVNVAVELVKARFGNYAGNFANAVLRKALLKLAEPSLPEELLPETVKRRWTKAFGATETTRLAGLFQREFPAVFRLRSNAGEFDPASVEATELALDFHSQWRCFTADPARVLAAPAFREGGIYFQDPAPLAAVMLAEPETAERPLTLLDCCAAPGGKSLLLAERLGVDAAHVTALDRSARRQRLTRENFRRCHFPARIVTGDLLNWKGGDPAGYDWVVLDAPCSNSGVFRRRPDALWRLSGKTVLEMAELQAQLLTKAAELTAPGGRLFYGTCSIEAEEDELQIAAFLAAHPGFRLEKELRLMPGTVHDGAYAAILRKRT